MNPLNDAGYAMRPCVRTVGNIMVNVAGMILLRRIKQRRENVEELKRLLKLKAQVLRNEAECLKNRIKLMELESKVHEIINNMEGVNHDGVESN